MLISYLLLWDCSIIAAVWLTCVPSESFNVTVLLSKVRLCPLFSTSPPSLWSCLSLGLGALCCIRESSLCLALYSKALCLCRLMRKHRGMLALLHSQWKAAVLHFWLTEVAAENVAICSIFGFLVYYQLCGILLRDFVHKMFNRACAYLICVSPTMLLLMNNPWSRSPIQKLLCDGD